LLIKIFPSTPTAHSNTSKKIQLQFNLIFSEKIIQYSRTFASPSPNLMEPSPCTPPHQELSKEHDLKHPVFVDLITTKQNKLPSFIDRYKIARFPQQVLAGSQNIKGFIKKIMFISGL
jgi:hypothetical protein